MVRAQNEKGETVMLELGGDDEDAMWVARIFQHEYDHLQVRSGAVGGRGLVVFGTYTWAQLREAWRGVLMPTHACGLPQGVLFHDRMKSDVLEGARASLVQLEEAFLKANPGAKVQRLPAPKVAKGFQKA